MSNMSYCRFQNTSTDLRDCVDAMEESYDLADLDLSRDEKDAMDFMRSLCEKFLEEHDRLLAAEDEDEDFDDSMDGDHESALASAGWGTDEDYGSAGDY